MRVLQITNESDGAFIPRMYSYWANAHVADDHVLVFAGHVDGYARFFHVTLADDHVDRLGSLIPHYTGTTEGWSFEPHGGIVLIDGPRLRWIDPVAGAARELFDLTPWFPGCDLWQVHSSDDLTVHSATVRQIVNDGPYPSLGTIVSRDGAVQFYPKIGELDESQITRNGRWLIIKEHTVDGDINRVIDADGSERIIRDDERAVGHSDCGDDFLVGEADKPDPGACVLWRLDDLDAGPRLLFETLNMGYVSTRNEVLLHSSATHLRRLSLSDGAVLEELPHGTEGDDYDARVKANLDATGRVAVFMSKRGGRFDVHLLVLD